MTETPTTTTFPAPVAHTIRWYARFPGTADDWMPATASMSRATNGFGWDAKCSCGWHTSTGGGVYSYVRRLISEHKFDVKHGIWSPEMNWNSPR